jgi:hypothetical protein
MRALLGCLVALCLPSTAAAGVHIVSAGPAGPVVAGQPVDIVVETDQPVDGARLTLPDLHGVFGETLCALGDGPGATRFVLPYRPGWDGVHVVGVTVTAGACRLRPESDWRLLRLEAAPASSAAPEVLGSCADADAVPIPRAMRAARSAVACLLDAARVEAGLAPLARDESLRRIASRSAHRPAGRGRPGEQRTVTPGTTPRGVVAAWLSNEAHRRDLLAGSVQRLGVAVVARFPEPMRRLEATYVVELG